MVHSHAALHIDAFITSELAGEWSHHAPAALTLTEEPSYSMDLRLGGPQGQCVCCGEDKLPCRGPNTGFAARIFLLNRDDSGS
jgi:hypothetical protein